MVRSALGKVAWVGRTASMVFGLALVMALVLGVAGMAFGANGQNFILGKLKNTATSVTGLVGNVDGGAALRVTNPNAGANDTALDLRVQAGEAPMRVNSTTRVAKLNAASAGRAVSAASADNATNAQDANTLDGKDSSEFLQSNAAAGGDLSGNYANLQIAGNAVGSSEVANGSLDVAEVTEFQFNFTVDLPPINGQSCYTGSETFSTVDSGDLVIVNAADDLPSGLVMFPLTPSSSNPQFKYRMCNITSSTIDLASGGAWRLAVFDDGNDN